MSRINEYRTIDDLVRIFKIKDSRQITAAFGSELTVVDGTTCLHSKYLIDRFGFDPTEPFFTRAEVIAELGITVTQFNTLIKKRALPTFKMVKAQGSAILMLKRDVDVLRQTLILYENSPFLLIDQNNKFREALSMLLAFDEKGSKVILKTKTESDIFRRYFFGLKNRKDIARELSVDEETVRISLQKCLSRFDKIIMEIKSEFTKVKELKSDIEKLQLDGAALRAENNQLREYLKSNSEPSEDLNNLLDSKLIGFCSLLSSINILDLPLSKRLNGILLKAQRHWAAKHALDRVYVSKLLFLLEVPIKELYQFRGFGDKCRLEIEQHLSEFGLIPNSSDVRIMITSRSVLNSISNKDAAWEFYNKKSNNEIRRNL
jgi:hypothetical protein